MEIDDAFLEEELSPDTADGTGSAAIASPMLEDFANLLRCCMLPEFAIDRVAFGKMKLRSSAVSKDDYKQPTTREFEFFGPHGTIFTIMMLPIVVIGLYLLCDQESCTTIAFFQEPTLLQQKIGKTPSFWNLEAFYVYVGWIAIQLFLSKIVPGKMVKGTQLPIPAASRLDYPINGLNCFLVTLGSFAFLTYRFDLSVWLWIAKNYLHLAVSGIIVCFFLSLALYLWSHRSSKVVVAKGGNSGYPIYDFWMGRELNPRLLGLDLKFLCELRPGLIGWFILNASLAAQQYHSLGRITNSMILVNLAQGYYVFDALINEEAILTTMDITTDGFGFMLVFGDLTWVPFTYSLQARYLSIFPQDLSFPYLALCISLNILGLYVFRSANSEKNAFRSNPTSRTVSHLKYLKTESGSKLLISGWWGMARKINYTGVIDFCLALNVFLFPLYMLL